MNRVRSFAATILMTAGTLALAPSLAGAQEAKDVIQGSLNAASPRDGRPYEVRTVRLNAGQRYEISLESGDFDPMIELLSADAPDRGSRGGDDDEECILASDDDGGEGNNALIEYTPDTSGTYKLRIKAVDGDLGRYTLKMNRLAPLPPPVRESGTRATMEGTIYRGALSRNDPTVRQRPVKDYLVTLTANKTTILSLQQDGDEFDPVLELYKGTRGQGDPEERDDDGGEGRDSLIVFTPEESGPYVIRATTTGEGGVGRFKLTVVQ